MPRFMVNDPLKVDPRARIRVENFTAAADVVAPRRDFIRTTGDNALAVDAGVTVTLNGSFFVTSLTNLSAANLDIGSAFVAGTDYYIYLCDPGSNQDEVYLISLNATAPAGFTAFNSRRIGGFHVGIGRRSDAQMRPINTAGVAYGAGWETNIFTGIIPASVWTLKHRPACSPEGMVYLGGNVWVDIYLASDDGAGGLQSVQNAIPLTGTEGLHWYAFNERAFVVGKRMLTHSEWLKAAMGAPQGNAADNLNAWSQTTNTARRNTGLVDRAVSSLGCRDTTGNVWEWIDEFISRYLATGEEAAQQTWSWHDVLGEGMGQAHMNATRQLVALGVGGIWRHGVHAGARAVICLLWPWRVASDVGVRLACESL
ncbi:MAG: SUMF1/EgtB/PvdO family nonheme iron enzyme [Defluviitaleaceae bacterium]|nr:SUMF1/EgtB/PvdO family nonheme iron enzyme [Defluviitaleaceae bacterium]